MSSWFRRFGFQQVLDGLVVGAYPTDAEDIDEIARAHIDVVYNLCEDAEYSRDEREAVVRALARRGIEERRLPLVDFGGLAPEALERAVGELGSELDAGRRVYLHCRAGWQRSAAVAAGLVAVRDGVDIEQALDLVRDRKPTAEPLEHQRDALHEWWRRRRRPRPAKRPPPS
jgi:atypical dual specificity phosphatase